MPMDRRGLPAAVMPAGTRWLAGSGRSGTTWVQDALAETNGLRPVFEPLHPNVSEIGKRYSHAALRADELHPELESYLVDAIAGRRERLWTQYRCQKSFLAPRLAEMKTTSGLAALAHRWRKFLGEAPGLAAMSLRQEPLVKCIWSNLMLGWLSQQCGFRIVLIVRHPGAVVESELRNGWSAASALERFRHDTKLRVLTGDRYRALFNRNLTPVQELAAKWLIENQWPMESAAQNKITIIHYERLRSSPNEEWKRVCLSLGLANLPDSATLARPSQQAAQQGSDAGETPATARSRWQEALTSAQLSQIQSILDETGFKTYAMNKAEPLRREGETEATRFRGAFT
jgi:hypothetical protein